jgi:integrase
MMTLALAWMSSRVIGAGASASHSPAAAQAALRVFSTCSLDRSFRGWSRTGVAGRSCTAGTRRRWRRSAVNSHDFRHHYASVLLAAGESVVAVARRLGHKDATLVLSTYGHLLPDSEERTRRAVDAARCAPDVPGQARTAGDLRLRYSYQE